MTNAYVMLTYRDDYCVGGMTNENADVMLISWNGRPAYTMSNENADVRGD